MGAVVRLARPDDAEALAGIYGPFVMGTPVSFEVHPPDSTEMRRRIVETLERFPWLVCDSGGEVLGYCYASAHRARSAYQWSVDTAVYIGEGSQRSGIGRALYTSLLALLATQGFFNAYAGITLPNQASVGLHEAMGFEPVGIYRRVGFKLGRWHDVSWWQRALQPHCEPVGPPISPAAARDSGRIDSALAAGSSLLRL